MPSDNHDSAEYRHERSVDPRVRKTRAERGWGTQPGRVPGQDSIEASREEPDRDDDGYDLTGYDSQMATRIGTEGSDDGGERLRQLHEGRHQSDGGHSARESERDKKRVTQAICSGLPLASHEREHVVNAVKALNLDKFGNQKSITKVTLGLVVVIVDERHRDGAEKIEQLVSFSDEFRIICDKHDIAMSDLSTIKQIARDELSNRHVPVTSEVLWRDPALPGRTAPSDKPHEYWDRLPSKRWVAVAVNWEQIPQEFKDAIPADHLETVDLLRRWEPWEDEEDEDSEPIDDEPDVEPNPVDRDRDDLDEELLAEARALVEEMEDSDYGE
ncbi:hypothetical protein [Haloferax sp. Q22]|uniref:hypothetical protein n=1 Tax=Haloferax sp. (strain Q22) TaxID=1526048 RepID=UPI000A45779F|nr:hypothetical protein [Haloferax sp. Q22]